MTAGRKFQIFSCMHDFEDAIINTVYGFWKETLKITGLCVFHFVKALREKADELGFHKSFKYKFLELFNFLTVIDRNLIDIGIEYVRCKARKLSGFQGHAKKVEEFINVYFDKQWNRERMRPLWNYNDGTENWKKDV